MGTLACMIVYNEVGATTATGAEDEWRWRECVSGREERPEGLALNHAATVRDRGGGGDAEGFRELVVNAKEGSAWGRWSVFSQQTRQEWDLTRSLLKEGRQR
jgi:hypothetical protein